jgi:hypothetical protein
MVEFVRDVMIAVALLAMLIALAVHPAPEAEPLRPSAVAPVITIGVAAPAVAQGTGTTK